MRRLLVALSATATLCACTVGPNFTPPRVASPPAFLAEPGGVASRTYGAAADTTWWTSFRDPELTSLVLRLAAQNLDLRTAAERVQQARAEVAIARSQALPHLGAGGKYLRTRQSPNGFISLLEPSPTATLEYNEYQPQATASWELDLFGRVRRETEAARADLTAQEEDRHAIALAAMAELASTYMQLRQVQRQQLLLESDLVVLQRRRRLVREQFAQGAANSLDVALADAQVTSTQQSLPGLVDQEATLGNALALLLAEPPRALAAELVRARGAQPLVPPAIPVGVPGDLVRRRPDIRRAEAELHAATAQTGVAVASFYPKISLSGDFSFDSLHSSTLFDWASRAFNVGPTVTLPIFEGGALRGGLTLAKSREREAAVNFQLTVLTAWHEADNALTAYVHAQQTLADASATLDANQRALVAASEQFRQGAVDYLNVVNEQSAVIGSQNGVAIARAGVEMRLVALYRALGGGWQAVPDPAAAPQSRALFQR